MNIHKNTHTHTHTHTHIYTYIPCIHMCVIQTEECGRNHKYIKYPNLVQIIKKIFKQIQLYTVLTQGINTIIINQLPNHSHFQKSVYSAGIKILNRMPSRLRSLKKEKVQFRAVLRRCLNIQSL